MNVRIRGSGIALEHHLHPFWFIVEERERRALAELAQVELGALVQIRDRHLANVRLHMGDALDVLARLPDASLRFVYLLHPDPWPKARHAKRRMVNHGPLDLIAAKLEPGGEFRLGTDDPVYCRWAMMIMSQRRDFDWLAESARDFLIRPGDFRLRAAGVGIEPTLRCSEHRILPLDDPAIVVWFRG